MTKGNRKQDRMKEDCECVLSFKKTEEGPKGESEILWTSAKTSNRSHGVGDTTPVLTSAVSLKSIKPCVVPSWAMWVTLLPRKVQKGQHWVKEDYFWASRSKGICFARFDTCLGPITSFFLFLPFGMGIWFHRFTAGDFCFVMSHCFTHIWFRYLDKTFNFRIDTGTH